MTEVRCSIPFARIDEQTPTVRATRTIPAQWPFWDAVAMAAALLAAERFLLVAPALLSRENLAMLKYEDEIEALRKLAWEGWERAVEAEDWQRAMRAHRLPQYEAEVARLAARVAVLEGVNVPPTWTEVTDQWATATVKRTT